MVQMTSWINSNKHLIKFLLLTSMFVILIELTAFATAIRNPSFVFINEAIRNNPAWVVEIRLFIAGALGGRADYELDDYDHLTPLELGVRRGNTTFLSVAVKYSSYEQIVDSFNLACADGNSLVIEVLRSHCSGLECPSDKK